METVLSEDQAVSLSNALEEQLWACAQNFYETRGVRGGLARNTLDMLTYGGLMVQGTALLIDCSRALGNDWEAELENQIQIFKEGVLERLVELRGEMN